MMTAAMTSGITRVLLIEDNPGDARLLRATLAEVSSAQFELVRAEQLSEALDRLSREGFDVVLLDLSLPDSHGLDTFIRTHTRAPGIPIVVLTGLDDEELAIKAVQKGAQDYLVKGQLDSNLLVRSLRYAIERDRLLRALRESEERYALAARGANDGLWDWNLKSNEVYYSPRWKSMLGFEETEIGTTPDEWFSRIHPEDRELVAAALAAHLEGRTAHFESEHRMAHKEGGYRWMLCRGQAVRDGHGHASRIAGTLTDITERKQAEEQIRASLREKEVLLKEIHHRVKNNLQIISSLLKLQSRNISDPHTLDMFRESQNRIKSMALIHEKLYQSKDLAVIDFAEYIKNLTVHLFRSYAVNPEAVRLRVDVQNVLLGIDTAIPCGLIINELVSNSLKYAFPPGTTGEVRIVLRPTGENRYLLIVADTGIGIPADFDLRRATSLGLRLVHTLIEQIGGMLEIRNSGGTEFRITFSESKFKERSETYGERKHHGR
jgi:PAS domain S-box-containing protein